MFLNSHINVSTTNYYRHFNVLSFVTVEYYRNDCNLIRSNVNEYRQIDRSQNNRNSHQCVSNSHYCSHKDSQNEWDFSHNRIAARFESMALYRRTDSQTASNVSLHRASGMRVEKYHHFPSASSIPSQSSLHHTHDEPISGQVASIQSYFFIVSEISNGINTYYIEYTSHLQ